MNTKALAITSLVMTFVGLLFLSEVRGHLNAAEENERLANFWKSKVAREQLKKLIVMGQFADFKQDVAVLLKEPLEKVKDQAVSQRMRDLASVIPKEKTLEINLGLSAEKLLAEGKERVTKRSFDEGIDKLKKLIDRFPDSLHVIEAHYLIIEALAQQEKNPQVIEWVDKMVELYPENRLTGYALLKVGDLYELDGRHQDAVTIYKTIVSVYQDKNLVSKAQSAVKELEL